MPRADGGNMRKGYVVVLLVAMVFAGMGWRAGETAADGELPRDAALRATFALHEPEFETLLAMLRQDGHLWRVGFDLTYVDTPVGTPPRAPTREELPAARWDEYRRLFRVLGLANGATRQWEGDATEAIYLPAAVLSRGAVDSEEKGFVYWSGTPEPLLESLDAPTLPVQHAQSAYARLKDRWYLYRRYNE